MANLQPRVHLAPGGTRVPGKGTTAYYHRAACGQEAPRNYQGLPHSLLEITSSPETVTCSRCRKLLMRLEIDQMEAIWDG